VASGDNNKTTTNQPDETLWAMDQTSHLDSIDGTQLPLCCDLDPKGVLIESTVASEYNNKTKTNLQSVVMINEPK